MIVFRMARLFDLLGIPGPDLFLRDYGRKALPVLMGELLRIPSGLTLTLDFADVAVMDTSFADESLLELALSLIEGNLGDRFLVLQQPSPAVIDNLEGTIARRNAKVALMVRADGALRIIGQIEPNLHEAWLIALHEGGPLTARDLADRLDLEISTASMRLRKLYDARLLTRREETTPTGRQYAYSVPV